MWITSKSHEIVQIRMQQNFENKVQMGLKMKLKMAHYISRILTSGYAKFGSKWPITLPKLWHSVYAKFSSDSGSSWQRN